MRTYLVFACKELTEQFRTYKTLIVGVVIVLFGILSPVTAKLTPELLKSLASPELAAAFPKPTYLDAYAQFFKNVPQFGVVVLLIVFGATISGELASGTLVNMLAKGMSRTSVLLAKYTSALLLWTLSYAVAAASAYGYSVYLFGHANLPRLPLAFGGVWLFGALVLALAVFASTIGRGSYGPLLISFGLVAVMLIVGIFPTFAPGNPLTLVNDGVGLVAGKVEPTDLLPPALVTLGLIGVLLIGGAAIFRRREL